MRNGGKMSDKVKLVIWKCKDGREIAVRDMEDAHLVNTIRYLERRAERIADSSNIMGAVDIMDFIPGEFSWFLPPQYDTMVAVAKGRGIKL